MISDSESSDIEYESDSDYCYDLSKQNTGTDRFITSDMKFIDFKPYPHIYDPFYPHIELIQSNDIKSKYAMVMNEIEKILLSSGVKNNKISLNSLSDGNKDFIIKVIKL